MNNCLVIFPLYRSPDALELSFLENGCRLLKKHAMAIVAPQSLTINAEFGELQNLPVYRFPDTFFESIAGYNRLLLSSDFYQAFSDYAYILIHQADVYVFSDQLQYWCNQSVSYIGSPWLKPEIGIKKWIYALKKQLNRRYGLKNNKVGNGGFSLRHVADAFRVLQSSPSEVITKYRENRHHSLNEDVFWSLEAPKIDGNFNIPDMKTGLRFGFEFNPETAWELNNRTLPFGCHAPQVHGRSFWMQFIPELKNATASL